MTFGVSPPTAPFVKMAGNHTATGFLPVAVNANGELIPVIGSG